MSGRRGGKAQPQQTGPSVARLAHEVLEGKPARGVEQYITRLYADQVEWLKHQAEIVAQRRGSRTNVAEFLRELIDAVIADWPKSES